MRSVLFAVVMTVPAMAGSELAEPVRSPAQDKEDVLRYWTAERMKSAEFSSGGPANPVREVITDGGDAFGFVKVDVPKRDMLSRRAGILFYQSGDGVDQHCSATVLHAPKGNLILTAAHCVVERGGKWKRNLLFVPAYDGMAAEHLRIPYGRWPIEFAFLPQAEAQTDDDTDIAVATVFSDEGTTLQATVGGASVACTSEKGSRLPNSQMWGYPGVIYSGGQMQRCLSRIEPSEISTGMLMPNCATMSGSSGSGFRFNDGRSDWVVGVVHGTGQGARLRESTFTGLYSVATEAERPVVVPPCVSDKSVDGTK